MLKVGIRVAQRKNMRSLPLRLNSAHSFDREYFACSSLQASAKCRVKKPRNPVVVHFEIDGVNIRRPEGLHFFQ